MHSVDLRQLYDSDPRPTFIVDCAAQSPAIFHVNTALLDIPHLALSLHSHNALRDWWDPASRVAARHQKEFRHGRYQWAKFTVCQRWLVVIIVEQPPPPTDETRDSLQQPLQLSRVASPLTSKSENIFTVKIQSEELREHIYRLRRIDWADTSLGPIGDWSYELNLLVTTLMLETRPTALFLGPDRIAVYNIAYGALCGTRHPRILGKSITNVWPELDDTMSAFILRLQQTRSADGPEEEHHFMVERNSFIEEAFFKWSLVPLVGVGSINGMYSIITEVTKQRLLERRVNALLRLGQMSSEATDAQSYWASIYEAIKPSEFDFPTAILYSQREAGSINSAGLCEESSPQCTLEWTIGYANDHAAIPKTVNLMDKDHQGLARAIAASAKEGASILFRERDGILPVSLFTDIEPRGFGDPCRAVIVIPVRTSNDIIAGYVIVGVNTRRPYDTEYQDWIEVFSNLLGTSAASVALHEKELRRRKRQEDQAAKDREALSAEVAVLAQEASNVAEKLQNFHDIANAVGLGYFEFGINGQLMHANEAFFSQTGHRRDIVNTRPFAFLEHVYEEDIPMAMEKWHNSAGGYPTTYEMRWKREPTRDHGGEENNRDYLWTLTACVPRVENGVVTGIFGCNTDITGQKEATRIALLRVEAERRLASFTATAPVGVYQCGTDFKITYCNEHWFQITGLPRVPLIELDWHSMILEEDMDEIERDMSLVMQGTEPHTFSFRVRKPWTGPDGIVTPTWILATATTANDEEGNVISVTGTLTDVSRLKWAEAIQRSRVEEALESKRQQENFIDMTSHEMRNPLSAMVQCADSVSSSLGEMATIVNQDALAAQVIPQGKLKDLISSSLDAIDTIQACATHQKRIVDDILTLSKLDSKLLVISPIVLQPTALLQDAYKMFKDEAHKARVDLEVQCDCSIAQMNIDYAILDPSRVLQVLINLLTNAIKFTQAQANRKVEIIMGASVEPEGKPGVEYVPHKSLRLDFLDQKEWGGGEVIYLHFTVKDTGCGLTLEHKDKLFQRFSQATPRTHVQYGGSGLGLFISRELTEMQGGGIGVQSTKGIGSTFSFYIKSRRAAPPHPSCNGVKLPTQIKTNGTQNGGLCRTQQPTEPQSYSNYHILVVEDNLINQRVLCSQLKKLGCTVYVANHGREALDEVHKSTYAKQPTMSPPRALSVVLMDVEMPVMDGNACTRRIRELEEEGDIVGHVPIIAVSANARREQIEQAKQAGMDDAISKPFRIPALLSIIHKVLGERAE